MIEELSSTFHKLEAHIVLNIPSKIISQVTDAVATVENLGIKVDKIGKFLRDIGKKKMHFELMQQAEVWETWVRVEEIDG